MRLLGDSIRRYHAEVLQPHWPVMRAHVRADRAHRADMALGHGLEHVLNTLHSTIRWRAPILEVAYPVDQDLHLEGRGLVLAPSFFCWQTPITLADPARQPMLLYPIDHHLDWSTVPTDLGDTPGPQSLVALLGRTRATVLQAIADSTQVNTTELARTTGVSLASASQHATVLRDAGLVVTLRRNGAAVHRLSVRGANLIDPATALSRL
jgi:DNA-binding transcriptional ArsR family regulator